MSLHDIGKSDGNRLNPRPNSNDEQQHRPAHDTTPHTYLSESAVSAQTTRFKKLRSRLAIPSELVITSSDNIQDSIDYVSGSGGGIVFLANGVYPQTSDIVIPSDVTLRGASAAAIIDFQSSSHQVRAVGTNIYSTGTVAINNRSQIVTGTATGWTTALIGYSIILGGTWFTVTAVASLTTLTIDSRFDGLSLSGQNYVIASVASNIHIENLTVINSMATTGAILCQSITASRLDDVTIEDCVMGFNFVDANAVYNQGFTTINCDTGTNVDNAGSWTFNNFLVYGSATAAMVFNRLISASVANFTVSSSLGNGITVTNCANWGLYDAVIINNEGNGIEITDSNDIEMFSLTMQSNLRDGIKLTSNTDRSFMSQVNFQNNGGYGLNIANANCDKNTVTSCSFNGNTTGTLNNLGTLTINANNQT